MQIEWIDRIWWDDLPLVKPQPLPGNGATSHFRLFNPQHQEIMEKDQWPYHVKIRGIQTLLSCPAHDFESRTILKLYIGDSLMFKAPFHALEQLYSPHRRYYAPPRQSMYVDLLVSENIIKKFEDFSHEDPSLMPFARVVLFVQVGREVQVW